jgi:transposase
VAKFDINVLKRPLLAFFTSKLKACPSPTARMVKTAKMIERPLEGVMAHWLRWTTNAFHEGLNSVFSAVMRKARGLRSTENPISMLYFTASHLDLPASN